MEIEKQVCSLELAKRLKELGVKQDSLCHWLNIPHITHMKLNDDGTVFVNENGESFVDRIEYIQKIGNPFSYNISKDDCWSAFTVAELGMLLNGAHNKDLKYGAFYDHGDDIWVCWEDEYGLYNKEGNFIYADTEADARAKTLIYLIEHKLISF